MSLKLDSLSKSIETLGRSLDAANARMDELGEDMQDLVRAGVIQHFEVAYEQCWKFIQRWLKENRVQEDATNPRSRKELFRLAARHGLIADPLPWFAYGDARNMTSHTYDQARAQEVYDAAGKFLADAQYLLRQLEAGND